MRPSRKHYGKYLVFALTVTTGLLVSMVGVARYFTPNEYYVKRGNQLQWDSQWISLEDPYNEGDLPAGTATSSNETYRAELMLFQTVPVKTVDVKVVEDREVALCGTPFGIKMFTNGVMVVGVADIQGEDGTANPGTDAGLEAGDIITALDGQPVNRNEEIAQAMEKSAGKPVKIAFLREQESMETTLLPVRSKVDGTYTVSYTHLGCACV